jgi:hypothetical protein
LCDAFFEARAAAGQGFGGFERERAQRNIEGRGEVFLAPFVMPGELLEGGYAPGVG